MGIAFVLILYAVALSALAGVASVLLGFGVRLYLRKVAHPKRLITTFAFTLPFLCVVYAGLWFVTYYAINDLVFHHDPGLGDGWYTNIGNGYAIDMIDVTDQGIIVHPTLGDSNGLNNQEGIDGVRRLQVSTPYLFGTQDLHAFEHLGQKSNEEDVFFVVNTLDHKQTKFSNESDLRAFASRQGRSLDLRPIASIYDKFRFGWFDYCAFAVLLLLPLAGLSALLYRAYQSKTNNPRLEMS